MINIIDMEKIATTVDNNSVCLRSFMSFVIFDFVNAVISHYNIKIYFYIIVYTLTSSFSDFDKMTNDIMTS